MLLLGAFTLYVALEDRKHPFTAMRHRKNRLWTLLLLLPIPVQGILFYMGEPHRITDQIGVVMALLQVALFWRIFKGYTVLPDNG